MAVPFACLRRGLFRIEDLSSSRFPSSPPTTILLPNPPSFSLPLLFPPMSFPKPISLPSSPGRGGGLAPPGSNPGSFTPASSIPNIPLRVPSPNTSGVQTSLGEKRAIPLASSSAALGGLGEASGLSASLQQKGGSGALAAEGAGPSGALTPNSVTR